jgi:hypothetical protein
MSWQLSHLAMGEVAPTAMVQYGHYKGCLNGRDTLRHIETHAEAGRKRSARKGGRPDEEHTSNSV